MNYAPNRAAAWWLATEIWPKVRARVPAARLLLVGADPDRRLQRLPAADPSIEVTGTVPDVRPYLWRSAVAVAPLRVARGVQNKILEAVAAGLPGVVTPTVLDGLPTAVARACLVADDADGLAAHIASLLRESPAARRRRAAVDLSTLSWERQLAPVASLLHAATLARGSR
jgi:glycosyltransferase involved in cell wall biosynthesis